MGTYGDSRITRARTTKACAVRCGRPIEKGEEQLTYKQGLKSQLYLHVSCALAGYRKHGRWRCAAIERAAVEAEGRSDE